MTSCACDTETKVYVGDVGTVLLVDTCVDITLATSAKLKVRKPDGTLVEWAGAVYDTTKIRYATVTNDLDQAGSYRIQSYVVMPSGTWRGNTATLVVRNVFE